MHEFEWKKLPIYKSASASQHRYGHRRHQPHTTGPCGLLRMAMQNLTCWIALFLLLPLAAEAQVERLAIGQGELRSSKMVEEAGIEPTSHRRRIMHPCCKCIAIQCVPRIPRTAPLQVDCRRIALLCKKTMPYICQTIWLPSPPPGPAYRTIRGRRSWPSSRLNKVSSRC